MSFGCFGEEVRVLEIFIQWLPAVSVIVAAFAAFVTYRSYLANQRFAEANYKPILRVKKTRAYREFWGVLFENELNRYCLIKTVTFTDERVKCEYAGHMVVTEDNNMFNRNEALEPTKDVGPFIKLIAQNNDKITGEIVLEVESFLGQKYKITTPEIIFENKDIKNQNRMWLEFLKVEKVK